MAMNYGHGRFSIGSYTTGQVRVTAVDSVPALTPRLRLHLAWTITPLQPIGDSAPARDFRITATDGELAISQNGAAIGHLRHFGQRNHLRSLPYGQEQQDHLIIDLDWYRFERLEEHRQGSGLTLWLQLYPTVQAGDEVLEAQVDGFDLRIPRDDWLAVISSITGDRTDLLEVRYHLTYAAQFHPSLEELRAAATAIDRGDYMSAVVRARKSLTLIEHAVQIGSMKDLLTALTPLVGEKHAGIYAGVASQVKNMGNTQAHEAGAREYSRAEALFAVRSSFLLAELFGSLLHRKKDP